MLQVHVRTPTATHSSPVGAAEIPPAPDDPPGAPRLVPAARPARAGLLLQGRIVGHGTQPEQPRRWPSPHLGLGPPACSGRAARDTGSILLQGTSNNKNFTT